MNDKELYVSMGKRLKTYRNKYKLTQEHMAESLEMSLTYYGRIERGKNGLSNGKLLLAYTKLGIDPVYLLTGAERATHSFEGLLKECPREKQYEMEQLIKFAMELVKK